MSGTDPAADGDPADLDALLRFATRGAPAAEWADVDAFTSALDPALAALPSTVARAVRGAARADRMGYAFVAGYFAALAGLGRTARDRARFAGRRVAVAATEVSGVHPRNIAARIEDRAGVGLTLRGDKTFVTLATQADALLVVARDGRVGPDEHGRSKLVAALVPADRDGVRVEEKPRTPFAPEVPHARVRFEDVAIEAADVLLGDGWNDWLKPFRTAEDVHVAAAAASHLLGVAARSGSSDRAAADLASVVAVALVVERSGWSSAGAHLALAGAFGALRRGFDAVVAGLEEGSAVRRRLERDALLLGVAQSARDKRTELSIRRLAGEP